MKKATICLNMIVKNESHVIQRCLASLKHLIAYWVIVDTGSTDGTQEIIRNFLAEIPGELYERPWVNFGHNRNEALALAREKADYILFIDADDQLVISDGIDMPELYKDCYFVNQRFKHMYRETYANNLVVLLIKDLPDFRWEGVVHEALIWDGEKSSEFLTGIEEDYFHDGDRSRDKESGQKDVAMLKQAIEEDPLNPRNIFYLAQTYGHLGEKESALHYYTKRVEMGGGREDEIFYSMLVMGSLQRGIRNYQVIAADNLCKAYLFRPRRAESLHELIELFVDERNYLMGYLIAKFALSIPPVSDPFELCVVPWVYDWGMQFQLYTCSKQLGKYQQAYKLSQALFSNPRFPDSKRAQIEPDLAHLSAYA
jgi:glycosyltransferase involved in cell wall biosynthesis